MNLERFAIGLMLVAGFGLAILLATTQQMFPHETSREIFARCHTGVIVSNTMQVAGVLLLAVAWRRQSRK